MCGIVGYIGDKNAVDIVLEGLRRLEYRGYDSAGIAVIGAAGLQIRRAAGRIKNLEVLLREKPIEGRIGLGHTRWATHGRPTDENAHPHTDGSGDLVVVHNGIIENYLPIKERLQAEGHVFKSETDTEVIAHLVERHLRDTPEARRGGAPRAPGAARLLRGGRAPPPDARPPGGGQARRGQRGGGAGRERDLPGLRHPGHPLPHPRRGDPGGRGRGGGDAARGRDHPARRRPGAADALAHPVGSDPRREGRLPPLHAEGDLRAAARGRRHHAGARAAGGRHRGAARRAARPRGRRPGFRESSWWPAARRITRPSSAASCWSA